MFIILEIQLTKRNLLNNCTLNNFENEVVFILMSMTTNHN